MDDKRRPTTDDHHGSHVTTPRAAQMMRLLGAGISHGSVMLTRDEKRAIDRLYGFVQEPPQQRPPKPVEPALDDLSYFDREAAQRKHKAAMDAWENWTDPRPFAQAGADLNAMRHAEADGLRMLAWIARYVEPCEDPVKVLVRLAIEAGWDVDPEDVEWSGGDGETEEEAA